MTILELTEPSGDENSGVDHLGMLRPRLGRVRAMPQLTGG